MTVLFTGVTWGRDLQTTVNPRDEEQVVAGDPMKCNANDAQGDVLSKVEDRGEEVCQYMITDITYQDLFTTIGAILMMRSVLLLAVIGEVQSKMAPVEQRRK
jgi:hypothetical protein